MKKLKNLSLLLIALILYNNYMFGQMCVPVVTYNTDHNLCEGSSTDLILSSAITLPTGCILQTANPYIWKLDGISVSSNDAIRTIPSPTPGEYYVEVTLIQDPLNLSITCPCTTTVQSNRIRINATPPRPNIITASTVECGSSIVLNATPPSGFTDGSFYWYDATDRLLFTGNGFNTGPLHTTTRFKVRYENNSCMSDAEDITITVNALPTAVVARDTTIISCNNRADLSANSITTGGIIKWYADAGLINLLHIGNTFTTPVLTTPTAYYVVNTNGTCTSTPKVVYVNTIQTPAPLVNSVISCLNSPLTITASHGPGALPGGIFEWRDNTGTLLGSGTELALPSSITGNANTYTLTVVENNSGCRSIASIQNLTILALPNLLLDTNYYKVCEKASISLDVSSMDTPSFIWEGPTGTLAYTGSNYLINNANKSEHEGTYTVRANHTSTSCKSEAQQIIVQVIPAPQISLLNSYTMEDGQQLQLSASGGNNFQWSPEAYFSDVRIPNPIFEYTKGLEGNLSEVITIQVRVDDANGCSDSATSNITINPPSKGVMVYNVLTPNNDGKNDVWNIDYLYTLPDYKIYVFDNQNNMIYFHDSKNGTYEDNPWNGSAANKSNQSVQTGTYNYVITSTAYTKPYKGIVTVLSN